LNTAVGQLLTREFRPPPGVTRSGKPDPASSYRKQRDECERFHLGSDGQQPTG
jgi:hypothetical protein